jgi:alkylation response protein AidB-like acyl-CoA dehydrogenase
MTTMAGGYAAEIAESARDLLDREAPRDDTLRRLRSEAYSARIWAAAAEAGWFRLLTAESEGGLEAGAGELAALFREVGRHLAAGPFAEAIVAGGLLRSSAELGPDTNVITFGGLRGTAGPRTATGSAGAVEHADDAHLLLLAADVEGGRAVIAVDPRDERVGVERLAAVDLAGRPCRVELRQASFEVVAAGEAAARLLERADALLAVAGAATLAGIARELVEMTVQYAKDRVQFERPIGSFQAVQHRLAEMAVTTAGIESAVEAAIVATEARAPWEAAALWALAAEMTRDVAQSALQVHGGIGFTDEHRLHAYLKRTLRLQAAAAEGDALARQGARLLGPS